MRRGGPSAAFSFDIFYEFSTSQFDLSQPVLEIRPTIARLEVGDFSAKVLNGRFGFGFLKDSMNSYVAVALAVDSNIGRAAHPLLRRAGGAIRPPFLSIFCTYFGHSSFNYPHIFPKSPNPPDVW